MDKETILTNIIDDLEKILEINTESCYHLMMSNKNKEYIKLQQESTKIYSMKFYIESLLEEEN